MISSVRGTVLAAVGTTAIIEVGGVGLSVNLTPQHALSLRVGHETSVRTTLIVREDDLSLYGFVDAEELSVFDLLRGVTGVGPKSAMGVLAAMSPGEIAQAVASEDDAAFRKVSGIGPKTAKLIVVSLAGKLLVSAVAPSATKVIASSVTDKVTIALIGLGWPERVAAQAVDEAASTASPTDLASVPVLLRLALAQLGPAGASQ
ncbi:MAG: Holliday junction branch migration protein RuvA [Rhodoglobus sp.]